MRIASLMGNLTLFVGAVLVVNGLIFGLGFSGAAGDPSGPPGWFVGIVWTMLFGLFGVAHWLLQPPAHGPSDRTWLLAFGILCLIYPFYTIGLSSQTIGLAGNIVTAAAAVWLINHLWKRSALAALLVAPVIPWLAFASWTIMQAMRT